MLDGEEYSPSAGEPISGVTSLATGRRKKNKNKKRFNDEQIRSLETIFESESRLEPRKKLQLAKELGLQPRQVAIWFQNKRARWKSKQLEREYSVIQSNYNSLASRFETLKKEKQALVVQLQKLNGMTQRPSEEGQCCEQNGAPKGREGGSDKGDAGNCESEEKPSLSIERSEHGFGVPSDEGSSIKTEYFGLDEEPNLSSMVMVEPADSLTSQEDWGSLDSDGIFDHSTTGYQWWDFWA